jgi:hypothetical protein
VPDSEARQMTGLCRIDLATPVLWRVYLASRPPADVSRATARLSEIIMSAAGTTHRDSHATGVAS